ncbi:MAG: hypothetical protein KBC47_02020 [Candidatus Peribacteraceae bacterium]|nr:hypothetical protein [Candidatus Peribacteraceae bacterium]
MLRRFHIARLAFQHSPETEQRLLSFAENNKQNEFLHGMHGDNAESISSDLVRKNIEDITNSTREKLAFLTDLAGIRFTNSQETDNKILNDFFSHHHSHIGKFYQQEGLEFTYGDWSKNTVSTLVKVFADELKEIIKRNKEKMGPQSCVYLSHDTFVRQYMISLGEKDLSPEACQEFSTTHIVPSAYLDRKNQSIIFDLSDARFNFEKQLHSMGYENSQEAPEEQQAIALEIIENNRQRAIVHELAHYSLDYVNKYDPIPLGERMIVRLKELFNVKTLDNHPQWAEVKRAVFEAFQTDGTGWKHEDILHEGLAMLAADNRIPEKGNTAAKKVSYVMRQLLAETQNDEQVRKLLDSLNTNLEYLIVGNGRNPSAFDDAMSKMNATTRERNENEAFADEWKRHNMEEDTARIRTLNPDINSDINTDLDETAATMANANEIIKAIGKAKKAVQSIQLSRGEYIQLLPSGESQAENLALDRMLESFSNDLVGLNSAENDAEILNQWETPLALHSSDKNRIAEKYNFASKGKYRDDMSTEEMGKLDKLNKEDRTKVIREIADIVAMQYEPLIKIAEYMEDSLLKSEQEILNKSNETEMSAFQKMQKALGPQNGIQWLSIFDMIKIYNIYKDAIVERYHSKQKVRVYDSAKAWNFWSPLQPDLDKQAKSANDEETEKFKEYLKKDGFTYEQLFNSGGVLDQNRGNINRAKAVIDYAADHAWLYKLDRTNGRDVYGVDYEGLWGPRTFEELVEHNAEQQDKESSAGYSKVNNHPEIPMIIDDMLEELEKKNIWQVHGMMKRLQEKAKLAESNTWAVTTLFRAMRDDPDVLRVMDIGMLDKIGGIGISQSAWTMTLYKTQRKKILAMKSAAEGATNKKEAVEAFIRNENNDFIMGQVIAEIESLLPEELRKGRDPKRHNSKYRDFTELDHAVAQVLAGQSVRSSGGKYISIFDNSNPIFVKYRNYFMDTTNTTPTEPDKTDPDFYNPQNGGSDLLLLGPAEIANNFSHTSQGRWTEENKALNFATQVLMRDVELGKIDLQLQSDFRAEMKKKFASYFDTNVLGQAAAMNTMPKYKTKAQDKMPPEIHNKVIFDEFVLRDMVDQNIYRRIKTAEGQKTKGSVI